MKRRVIAQQVTDELLAAEAAMDEVIAKTARLMATLSSGRIQANIPSVVGQPAFARLGEVVAMQTQVRGLLVEAHQALSVMQKDVGLGGVAFGFPDKPGESLTGGAPVGLIPSARVA